jgi:hypothetical protein
MFHDDILGAMRAERGVVAPSLPMQETSTPLTRCSAASTI